MSRPDGCASWPEVEAAADGRFGPREVERVGRHLAQCASCRARREALIALREEARAHARAPVSELDARRARAALLRAAAVGDERPRRQWGIALAGAVAVAAAVVAVRRGGAPVMPHAVARVDAGGGARWTRAVEPSRETVRLEEGSLQVTVPRQHAGHRFVVALPDGEIEVRGTRFVVEARRGRTERVVVFEGLVALRVAGAPERLLAAGARWAHEVAPVVASAAPATTPATSPSPAAPNAPVAPAAAPRRAAADDPFRRFAAGVEAMGRGDFRVAAESFATFERERPGDERAEDAGWLRVVALRRGGDEAGAQAAAARYLARYPAGARRGEASALLARAAAARGDCVRALALAGAAGALADDVRARCGR
ncbi:MAG: FecR family protein [Polyangiales bacterium]